MVTAIDDAGNIATLVRSVVLDTVAPFIELFSPYNDSYVPVDDVQVSGRTEPGSRVLVDGLEIVISGGRFEQRVPLPKELNILNVTVLDAAGNANSTFLTVHVDTVPPGLEIFSPRMGHHTGKGYITINGTTEPFSTVTAGEFMAVAGQDGSFSINVTLLQGNNTFFIKSTDRAGNSNTSVWYVVRSVTNSASRSPWLEVGILVAIFLATENVYFLWRARRLRSAVASSRMVISTVQTPASITAPCQPVEEPPFTQPLESSTMNSVPPEALPVVDTQTGPDGSQNVGEDEANKMKR